MNSCINLSAAKRTSVPAINELRMAREMLDLRINEAALAQKSVTEAENHLNSMVIEALKAKAEAYSEGEIIYVVECNRLFCYYKGEFEPLPSALDALMERYDQCSVN